MAFLFDAYIFNLIFLGNFSGFDLFHYQYPYHVLLDYSLLLDLAIVCGTLTEEGHILLQEA